MKIRRLYCSIEGCKKSFRSEEQLASHLLSHEVPEESSEETYNFQCEICFAKFSTKRSVSAHKRVHKKEEKEHHTQNFINFITQKFTELDNFEKEIPSGPYSIENLKFSPISQPTPALLPLFSSIINSENK